VPKYCASSTRLLVNTDVEVCIYPLPRNPVTGTGKLTALILVHIQVIQDVVVHLVNIYVAYMIGVNERQRKATHGKIWGNYEWSALRWQLYVHTTSASNFGSFRHLSFTAQSIQATNLHSLFRNWKWSWPADVSKDTWEHVLCEFVRTPLKPEIHLSESE
jgi:hypothetical protein